MKSRMLAAMIAAPAAIALAACGGSPVTTSAAGPARSHGGAPALPSVAAPSSGGGPHHVNVCADFPLSAARQVTGVTFTSAKPSSVEGIVFSCEYDGPSAALLQISVQTQDGDIVFKGDISTLKTVGHAPTLVSGVGSEAFSEPDPHGGISAIGASSFASYGAVFGDVYIRIGGLTYVTSSEGRQIVEQLHSKL